ASTTPKAGTISPPANTWIWNLPLVAAAQRLEMVSAPPKIVSIDFGKLDAMRHLISGCVPWPMTGAATAPAARPTPAFFRNERRSMCPSTRNSTLARLGTAGGARTDDFVVAAPAEFVAPPTILTDFGRSSGQLPHRAEKPPRPAGLAFDRLV